MEQMTSDEWPFDVAPDSVVVTSSYVTREHMPVLYVTHEEDPEEGVLWQFHCGNADYSPDVLRLVRLDELLALEGDLIEVAKLPLGFRALRSSKDAPWVFEPEPASGK